MKEKIKTIAWMVGACLLPPVAIAPFALGHLSTRADLPFTISMPTIIADTMPLGIILGVIFFIVSMGTGTYCFTKACGN